MAYVFSISLPLKTLDCKNRDILFNSFNIFLNNYEPLLRDADDKETSRNSYRP